MPIPSNYPSGVSGNEPEITGRVRSDCAIHNQPEWAFEPFTVCFECGHIWETPEEIESEFSLTIKKQVAIDAIGFCPLCLHDW